MVSSPVSSTYPSLQAYPPIAPASGGQQQAIPDQVILQQALQAMGRIQNLPANHAYMHHMGVTPPFQNGAQALQLIQQKGIRVEFGDMGDSPAHAQWISEQNLILINQRYRGDASPTTLKDIAAAIYHEAGHASGNGDGESSVQEELDCLALNTLAYRYHAATDPGYAAASSQSALSADGVALYPKLFFDVDPQKQKLINRVVQKYGDLPMWSPGHAVPPITPGTPKGLAYRVAEQVDANNVSKGLMPPSPALTMNPQSPQLFPTAAPIPTPDQVAPAVGQRLSLSA